MIWNKENVATLEQLYDAGKTDEQIALIMGAKSAYSVAKARSVNGIVKFKKKEGLHRKEKTIVPKISSNFTVLYYVQDGQDHFAMVGSGNPKTVAQSVLIRKGVSEVFLLAPKSKLIMQQVTEISL